MENINEKIKIFLYTGYTYTMMMMMMMMLTMMTYITQQIISAVYQIQVKIIYFSIITLYNVIILSIY